MKKVKRYTTLQIQEGEEEDKSIKAIKDLIELDWSKDEDAQGTALALFKALVYADTKPADAFIKKVSDYTSGLSVDEFSGEKKESKKKKIKESSRVEVEMYGSVGGHSSYGVPSFERGMQEAISYYKHDLPKEDGMDITWFIGVFDYESSKGSVVFCNPSYLKVVHPNSFKKKEYYDSFMNACKQNIKTKKPVEYKFGTSGVAYNVIDIDERGEFSAHLEDEDGNELMSYDGDIFEAGFMRNKSDMNGLFKYATGSLGLDIDRIEDRG